MRESLPGYSMSKRHTVAETTSTCGHAKRCPTTMATCTDKAFHVAKDTILASFGQKQHARLNHWSPGTAKGMDPRKSLRP